MDSLYNENHIFGSLFKIFDKLFSQITKSTRESLTLFLIGLLFTEHFTSVRNLHKNFLSKVCNKSLNSYYYAISNNKINNTFIRQTLARIAVSIIPKSLAKEPIFLAIDDTTIAKFGKKFDNVQFLYDHSIHDAKQRTVNGHCFVSMTMYVPVSEKKAGYSEQIRYIPISIGYILWTAQKSKLELAADLIDEIIPELKGRKTILLFDSWYAKTNLIERALSYSNVGIVCNARCDTAMWDLPAVASGRRGRPRKHGNRLYIDDIKDFHGEIIIDKYKVTHRVVKTNIFGNRTVHAYVTRNNGSCRLFFSTITTPELHMSCAWNENSELRNCPVEEAVFYPLKLYKLRWSIETNYYEQKTFWSLNKYMIRKHVGIERLLNIINSAHSMAKILPYMDNMFCKYKNISTQECRYMIGEEIRKEMFFAGLARYAQTAKNSRAIMSFLEVMGWADKFVA